MYIGSGKIVVVGAAAKGQYHLAYENMMRTWCGIQLACYAGKCASPEDDVTCKRCLRIGRIK